jgi:hypothetical protein
LSKPFETLAQNTTTYVLMLTNVTLFFKEMVIFCTQKWSKLPKNNLQHWALFAAEQAANQHPDVRPLLRDPGRPLRDHVHPNLCRHSGTNYG